jgi:hypothetical protein
MCLFNMKCLRFTLFAKFKFDNEQFLKVNALLTFFRVEIILEISKKFYFKRGKYMHKQNFVYVCGIC